MHRRSVVGGSVVALTVAAGLLAGSSAAAETGAVTVSPGTVTATATLGAAATAEITVTNHTGEARRIALGESGGGFAIQAAGPARRDVPGAGDPHRLGRTAGPEAGSAAAASIAPAAAPWEDLAAPPRPIMDNAVAVGPGGTIWSIGGVSAYAILDTVDVYDPETGRWTTSTPIEEPLEQPSAAFLDGRLYVAGGWAESGAASPTLSVYDPGAGRWEHKAANPAPLAAAGTAVVAGDLYLVGGCEVACGATTVVSYDPETDVWTERAPYPQAVSWTSCGAIGGRLYCSGGTDDETGATVATYAYTPDTDSWTRLADMPEPLWAAGYTAANGRLLVSGGSTGGARTNAGYQYDPASNAWSPLPNANHTLYRGGSTCGLYRIGGADGTFDGSAVAERLPGYSACGGDVPWLSAEPDTFTLDAGAARSVALRFDSATLTQPGRYTAQLTVGTDRGDRVEPVAVEFTVAAPANWSKVAGTVTTAACAPGGAVPLDVATVTVVVDGVRKVLGTDRKGAYALWLDTHGDRVTVIAAKDGWRAALAEVHPAAGATAEASFALKPYPTCPTG